jgi:riboflavin synthase
MFTGIVEAVGKVITLQTLQGGMRLTVQSNRDLKLKRGDSLAVDGVCLTCEKIKARRVEFVLSAETLERSRFKTLKPGVRVNLERPLAAAGRLGGHFVQGHVDGTAKVAGLDEDPPGWRLSVDLDSALARYCIQKGSIAINGVSLTIAGLRGNQIWTALIPYTWKHTALSGLKAGDPVNIEVDMLAKYAQRFLQPQEDRSRNEEFLWKFIHEG